MQAQQTLASIWQLTGLPVEALGFVTLTGLDPVFSSSFAVGTAAQASIAAAALAACELGHQRSTPRQKVAVDLLHAAQECSGWFSINGVAPDPWDKFSGLYRCADGWVRVHANFAHHRVGALKLMGLDPTTAERLDAERAML
ncbi:MAG: CoA transferase, partial [Pseudomonadota bacterium]